MSQNVLEVKNLCKYFEVGKGLTLKAVFIKEKMSMN